MDDLFGRIVVGEQCFVEVAVDDADPRALLQVVLVDEAAAEDPHVLADLAVVGHDADHRQRLRLSPHGDGAPEDQNSRHPRENVGA